MTPTSPDLASLARHFDHTLLAPDATPEAIARLCREARAYGFFSVCVNPWYVSLAHSLLDGSACLVCSVCGFPLGANRTETKRREAQQALLDGAREIDMVLPLGAVKAQAWEQVRDDLRAVIATCRERDAGCKVILETCLLSTEEKRSACSLCIELRADFVKTSTGFGHGGATTGDVRLLSSLVRDAGLGVKASGGIRDLQTAQAMIAAGATRLGASASVRILDEARQRSGAGDS